MKLQRPLLAIPLATLLLSLPAAAQTAVLTGTAVDSNGQALVGVDIDVINENGADPTLNNDSTGAGGVFAVEVTPPGTYRIELRPPQPPASTALARVFPSLSVTGTTDLGVVVHEAGVSLTARVLNPGSVPVQNVDIDVLDGNGVDLLVPFDNTNALGRFTIAVPLGPSSLRLDPTPVVGQILAPQEIALDLDQNTDLGDLTLEPGFLVTAIIRRTNNSGVQNADVDAIDVVTGEKLFTPGDNSDSVGFVDFVVPQGTYDFEICPPPGELLLGRLITGIAVNGSTSLGVVQLQPGVLLSGTVRSPAGNPVAGVDIDVAEAGTTNDVLLCHDGTDAQGQYSVVVPTGTFDVTFDPPYALPMAADVQESVVVNGNTLLDGALPPCAYFTRYGQGLPGTGGFTPAIGASGGTPRIGNENYTIEVASGLGGATVLLYVSLGKCPGGTASTGGPLFLTRLATGGRAVMLTLDGTPGAAGVGRASYPMPIPASLEWAGLSVFAVAAVSDPQGPGGTSQTKVLCSTICE